MPNTLQRRVDAAATLRVTGHEGARTAWRSWGAGPHLVLLHGSAGSWNHWLRNIEELATSHTVHAPDIPGFGDSPEHAGPPTFGALAEVLLAGYQQLAPDTPFALAGFSFGSVLAESMALARPDLVRQLLLVRGRFDDTTPAPPAGLQRWRGISDPDQLARAQRHNLATLMFHDPARIDAQAVRLHTENARRAVLDLARYGASRPARALARLRMPISAIAGQHDCYAAAAANQQRQALLDARPDALYRQIPGAGHWVNYEAADAFNPLMLDCLRRHATGAGAQP